MVAQLGGAPGRYVVAAVVLAIVWVPLRLWIDEGDPFALTLVSSGLYGSVWALMLPVSEWWDRRKGAARTGVGRRRGAIVGLSVGVPFYGALLALCLATDRFWVYPVSFAVILAVVVAISLRRLLAAGT